MSPCSRIGISLCEKGYLKLSADQMAMVKFWVEHCAIGETLQRGVTLVEEVILVTDPDQLPFDGRRPGCDPAAGDDTCCAIEGDPTPS